MRESDNSSVGMLTRESLCLSVSMGVDAEFLLGIVGSLKFSGLRRSGFGGL